jgi:2,4-dienoyl-CoA reductase-like NADH-dependent reductase (Old Yellow Enzyme family)
VFAQRLAGLGIDLLDVSSGALAVDAPPPNKPGLNLEFAEVLKEAAGIAVAPVGQLSGPELLGNIFASSTVDAVIVGRALLRDPYFVLRLAAGQPKDYWPLQYHRALQPGPSS